MKNKIGVGLAVMLAFVLSANAAQLATNVEVYLYTTSVPYASGDMGITRDNLMEGLKSGGVKLPVYTGSRVEDPTAFEIRQSFDTGDIATSTNGMLLWRGTTNMPGPGPQYGNQVVCLAIFIGIGGQISLNRIGQELVCENLGTMNYGNWITNAYSRSRVGIRPGNDGKLFTTLDDVTLDNGEPATELVDAIVYMGAAARAGIQKLTDVTLLDTAIGPNGRTIEFTYYYRVSDSNITSYKYRCKVYQLGKIPKTCEGVAQFKCPGGMLWSHVASPGSTFKRMATDRDLQTPWRIMDPAPTEGSSVYMPYSSAGLGFLLVEPYVPFVPGI
jgi:hypothetical protein